MTGPHRDSRRSVPFVRRVFAAALTILVVSSGCGPVIETAMRADTPFVKDQTEQTDFSAVLDFSGLELTAETLDPAALQQTIEATAVASGRFRTVAVDKGDDSGRQGRIVIALSRLEYRKRALRLPPPPPFGLVLLYPFVFPLLLQREYIKLEVVVQADLLLYDDEGRLSKQLFLSESATGRANMFNSGEAQGSVTLQKTAFHNFSRQVVSEFLFLTR